MLTYNPGAWYWRANDDRLYSSAAKALVQASDPAFVAWTAAGGIATVWPRDDAGAQTQDALDHVLLDAGVLAGVPDVSSAQAKIALSRGGLLDKVKAAVASAGGEVEIWFTDARTWQRRNPHVVAIGAALDLPSDQIDALFRQAAVIAARRG